MVKDVHHSSHNLLFKGLKNETKRIKTKKKEIAEKTERKLTAALRPNKNVGIHIRNRITFTL